MGKGVGGDLVPLVNIFYILGVEAIAAVAHAVVIAEGNRLQLGLLAKTQGKYLWRSDIRVADYITKGAMGQCLGPDRKSL